MSLTTKVEYTEKEFSVQEVIDAIAENSFDHLREEWIQISGDGKITGGCALSQGAFNLGVIPSKEVTEETGILDKILPTEIDEDFWEDSIVKSTLIEALDKFYVLKTSKWHLGGTRRQPCGYTIVHWNDQQRYNVINNRYEYTLSTYEDVVTMVKEVLERHKDKKITLQTVDYSMVLG